jgi:2-polyprenyl-3-methyl-5-hydroxy-6-metoxy-1,4-benzoquinol methylase
MTRARWPSRRLLLKNRDAPAAEAKVPAHAALSAKLHTVVQGYPEWLRTYTAGDVPRTAFLVDLVLRSLAPNPRAAASVCDLGGGSTLFAVACAAVGIGRSVVVDDFGDTDNNWVLEHASSPQRSYGVEVHSLDLVADGIASVEGTFDVITCLNCMEHFHHSPKTLFHDAIGRLRPGGFLLLSAPNCVNLRKRLTVPFGRGKWTALADWYDTTPFRGHVREPDVEDLRAIARDLSLENVKVFGRNWTGINSPKPVTRSLARVADVPLRLMPSLCSDIYVMGRKQLKR